MRLSYYIDPRRNFGDDLNEWIWDRAAPGFVNQDDRSHLVGIGTLLGSWFAEQMPQNAVKVVIGTGAGGKGQLPEITDKWRIYGVRGPLSAAYFRLDSASISADPAILVHEYEDLHATGTKGGVGFMPHVWSCDAWNWQEICERLGLTYVDPRADTFETIALISRLDKLVTEAMHGAIVADALRVPWVAVQISRRFDASKWCDWAGALSIDIKFHRVLELRQREHDLRKSAKGLLKYVGAIGGMQFTVLHPAPSTRYERKVATAELREICKSADGQLSKDKDLTRAIDRVKAALDRARNDQANGLVF